MVAIIQRYTIHRNPEARMETYEVLAAPGSSSYIRLQGTVSVQLSGTATAITAIVERSSRDPGSAEANWAPAEDTPISGNLANGISPRQYTDPATGFWRLRITALTGGNCQVSIIGEQA